MGSLALAAASAAVLALQDAEIVFTGPRIVRLEEGIHSLRTADFDGDGHGDAAVVNNAKARIELLLHRPAGSIAAPVAEKHVPADEAIFERRGIVTEKRVGGLACGDFDADGRIDLAWYGNPKSLVIAYQGERMTEWVKVHCQGGRMRFEREWERVEASFAPAP